MALSRAPIPPLRCSDKIEKLLLYTHYSQNMLPCLPLKLKAGATLILLQVSSRFIPLDEYHYIFLILNKNLRKDAVQAPG